MWKHCPLCGGVLADKTQETYGKCTKCGQVWYKNPKPTVGVYIARGTKVLLVKRADEPKKGYWDTPGGFVKEGEHPFDAARREAKEELNAEITNLEVLDFFGPGNYQYQKSHQINMEIGVTAELLNESELSPADDAEEFRWFDLSNIPQMAFEVNDMGLTKLKKRLSSS